MTRCALSARHGMRRPRRRIETVRVGNAAVKIYRRTRTVDGKARCAGTRLAPITENLARWLSPLAKESGPVWPTGQTWRERARSISAAQNAAAEAAGLLPWRHNSLRHSFCTFRVAATQDVPRTALEAGNSAATIFSHYRALATEAQGKAWFAIVPPRPAPEALGRSLRGSSVDWVTRRGPSDAGEGTFGRAVGEPLFARSKSKNRAALPASSQNHQ